MTVFAGYCSRTLGAHILNMTRLACPHRAVLLTPPRQIDMTVSAQPVEHCFRIRGNLWIALMAVVTKALAGVVGKVVVTGCAILFLVVSVGEGHRQQRTLGALSLPLLVTKPNHHHQTQESNRHEQALHTYAGAVSAAGVPVNRHRESLRLSRETGAR